MELDDLKGVWKHQTQQEAKELLSDDALHAMLSSKATNTVDLLKKSVRFELLFTGLFILACLTFSFATSDESLRNIALVISLISCGFGFYYYKKLTLLNDLTIESQSIKENLTGLIIRFQQFLWFYRWGYNILIPIALLSGALIGVSVEKDFDQLILQPKLWIVLIAILVPIAILFNFGMKWYLQKLYGRHLSHLNSLLKELQD